MAWVAASVTVLSHEHNGRQPSSLRQAGRLRYVRRLYVAAQSGMVGHGITGGMVRRSLCVSRPAVSSGHFCDSINRTYTAELCTGVMNSGLGVMKSYTTIDAKGLALQESAHR
jgi:hypothetical protein